MKVILLMAMTLDGKIARSSTEFVDWTGPEDKDYFVTLTRKTGAMIMGSATYDTIGHPLPDRKNIIMTRDPKRVSDDPALIYTSDDPETILNLLKKEGYKEVALIGGSRINALFAEKKLITEIHVTVAPKLFGQGLSLFDTSLDLELSLMDYSQIGENHLLLKYSIKKGC